MFIFETFNWRLNGYVPLNILILNYMAFSLLLGRLVRNFLYFFCKKIAEFVSFLNYFFLDETWLPTNNLKFAALISI